MIRAITRQGSVTVNYVCPYRLCGDRRGGDPDLPASTDCSFRSDSVCVCKYTVYVYVCVLPVILYSEPATPHTKSFISIPNKKFKHRNGIDVAKDG